MRTIKTMKNKKTETKKFGNKGDAGIITKGNKGWNLSPWTRKRNSDCYPVTGYNLLGSSESGVEEPKCNKIHQIFGAYEQNKEEKSPQFQNFPNFPSQNGS